MQDSEFLQQAVDLAEQNVADGGWPFSSVIVKDDQVISQAVNRVVWSHDPSDHAEIAAIRDATTKLGSPDLSGCTIYMVAPPCPMCLTCMHLARISRAVYCVGVEEKDAALTNLPATLGLYGLLEQPFTNSPITFEHQARLQERGTDVLADWNSKLG